ncbi:MAG: hypothetical protein ACR2NP_01550 [Pirellulaceae bacterium]
MLCSRTTLTLALSVCWVAFAGLSPGVEAQEEPASPGLPSAEQIIDRYIEEIGSEMGLSSIETLTLEADFEGLDRGSGNMSLNASGNYWHYDFQTTDGQITYHMCQDGTAWENQYGSIARLSGNDRVKFEEIIPVIFAPLRWLDYPGQMETTGVEEVRSKKCYVIEFRPEGGKPVRRYFDMESGLLVRMSYDSNSTNADWYLSDYQEVEGFTIPMRREQYFSGSHAYTVKTTSVVINEPVDEELLEPPLKVETAETEDDPFGGGTP